MELEEIIDFLRTADDEACSKFIEERLQYLNENEILLVTDKFSESLK